MSIERAYGQGWGVGEKLTSAQMNTVDANAAAGIDGRAGQIDAFMSLVVATGAGRIVSSVATGPDADKTFYVDGGNSIVRIPTLTAARSYLLGNSGATGGDRMFLYYEGTGGTVSGYVDIKNAQGTGLFRLASTIQASPNLNAEGDTCEFMFNGSSWQLIQGAGPGLRAVRFTTTTTWICPPGVHQILARGWGGGGGGGGGGNGWLSSAYPVSGAGGGAALASVQRIPVAPLTVYTITIGAGGSGGQTGVNDGFGNDGTDTTISVGSTILARFLGAAGGGSVATINQTLSYALWARGGGPIKSTSPPVSASQPRIPSGTVVSVGNFGPGFGGMGAGGNVATMLAYHFGIGSIEGYTGGAPGIVGSSPSGWSNLEKSFGGGGGAAGPGGDGGAGGDGGISAFTVVTGMSSVGLAASANSGAGGGGGGAGAVSNTSVPNAGTGSRGGAGGTGEISLWTVK